MNITISVFGINDNAPIIHIPTSSFDYVEESGPLSLGFLSDVSIQDSDHEQNNILISLRLRLSPVPDGNQESIRLNTSQLSSINIHVLVECKYTYNSNILTVVTPLHSFKFLIYFDTI